MVTVKCVVIRPKWLFFAYLLSTDIVGRPMTDMNLFPHSRHLGPQYFASEDVYPPRLLGRRPWIWGVKAPIR